jgi:hypothetical protein
MTSSKVVRFFVVVYDLDDKIIFTGELDIEGNKAKDIQFNATEAHTMGDVAIYRDGKQLQKGRLYHSGLPSMHPGDRLIITDLSVEGL